MVSLVLSSLPEELGQWMLSGKGLSVKGQPMAGVGPRGQGVRQSGSKRAYEEIYKNSFHPQHNLHQVTSIVSTFPMANL